MIDFITVSFLNGYAYVKKHPELLMTLLLIIVVPAGFLFSGQQFLTAAKENQERLEKDRIGMLHDVFASFLVAAGVNGELVQSEIEKIVSLNPDITAMQVVGETQEGIKILASRNPEEIGLLVENPTAYRIAHTHPGESLIVPYVDDGVRYWQSYRLLEDGVGLERYIFTETSLVHIDSLFATRVVTAYYWLFGILAVVLILILRHVRLIDYGYLYRETKRANEMQDLFTNMMAHELRAPLTAVRGYASMIEEGQSVPDDAKKQAWKIRDSAERLLLIVNDLLDVARIRGGKLQVKNERTNAKEVILSVIDAMQAPAKEKQIELIPDGVIPDAWISIDGRRFNQALTNLVSNAIKYTKAGKITIALEERRDRVEIRVKDTGMGISAEDQKNLFAPFFRVESEEVDRIVGTGLGMWITKQLIELMKGSIAVESIRGIGTHVVVTFPK